MWFPYNRFSLKPAIRLFCFGHSGSTASFFRSWQEHFASGIEICPLQLPGRETSFSQPLIYSMDILMQKLWPDMQRLMDLPFAFFGHSLGAMIAYELARKVESSSLKNNLKQIFVSACSAPSALQQDSPIHSLPNEEFITCLKGYGAMPSKLLENHEALQLLLPRIRADFSIFETYIYQPSPPLQVSIAACSGREDDIVEERNIRGWEAHTNRNFKFHVFPGGHFYPQEALKELCEVISGYLNHHL